MDTIMFYVSGGIILLLATVLYVWLISNVLPKALLKQKFRSNFSTDRGLSKYTYPGGRAIVYEPHPVYRKYIKLYMLHTSGGYKYIRCKVSEGTSALTYDVYMFDNRDNVIDTIRISEKIPSSSELGKSILLHENTSYVKIIIRRVNNLVIKTGDVSYVTKNNVNKLYAFSALMSSVMFLAIRFAMLTIFELLGIFNIVKFSALLAILGGAVIGLIIARSYVKETKSKGIEVLRYEK